MQRGAVVARRPSRARPARVSHSGIAYGHRGWNRHPVGIAWRIGYDAGDRRQPLVVPRPTWGIAASSPSVYGWCGRANSSSTEASSTTCPAYITTTRRAEVGDHAEVVGDEDHRHPEPRLERAEQVEDLRLHGDVERGRGLVGDEQARLAREREREQRALAHAARELVRVVVEPTLGVGDADEVEQLDRACARASRLLIFRCSRIVSTSCVPMVNTGLRLVIGSWKTMAISSPRTSRISRSESGSRSRPSNITVPETMRPGGDGTSRITASDVTVLPEPDSPTMPSISPGRTLKLTLSTTVAGPASVRNCTDSDDTLSRRRSPPPLPPPAPLGRRSASA